MATTPFPNSFISKHPRYVNESTITELVPGTYSVLLVSQLQLILPQVGNMTGYAGLSESIVVIPDVVSGEEPGQEPTVSADNPVGGINLTHADLVGLPGATEFLMALHGLIISKHQALNTPTP